MPSGQQAETEAVGDPTLQTAGVSPETMEKIRLESIYRNNQTKSSITPPGPHRKGQRSLRLHGKDGVPGDRGGPGMKSIPSSQSSMTNDSAITGHKTVLATWI